MATTLDHSPESPPVTGKGHGTAALGPSDSSDTGSDIRGGPGLAGDAGLLAPSGDSSDADPRPGGRTAGPDIGDADLDSDSDRNGTGERAAAGRDATLPVDAQLRDEDDRLVDGESLDNASARTAAADGEVVADDRNEVADDEQEAVRASAGLRNLHVPRG